MPFATTIKYDVKIEKGPPPESAEYKIPDIDSYLPITMTIPVKPMARDGKPMPQATEIVLDAGKRDRVKFLLISASEYADPNCSKTPVALLLQFAGENAMDWADVEGDKNPEVIWLTGPLMFSGYTLAMLPDKLDKLYVQNHRGKDIELKILIGKSFSKPSMMPIPLGVEEKAAAQRGGIRAAQMASR